MSLLNEISSTLLAAKDVPQDLRDPECKSLCDKLTSHMWKVLVNNLEEGDISQENYISAMEKTYSFPHLGSRVYEVAVFHGMKSNLIRGEDPSRALAKYDLMLDFPPPIKSNLFFKGCINYKLSGIKEAQYYFLKGNQEYIEGSVVTSFFSYSRSICPFDVEDIVLDFSLQKKKSKYDNGWWILVSADSKYITRFLNNYALSIKNHATNIGLHLHWIDNSESFDEKSSAEEVINFARNLLGSRFDVTRQDCPKFRDSRTFFANSRFLIAKEVIKNKRGLIITDIDYQLIENPENFIDWCEEIDVGLQVKSENLINSWFPWLKVLAGTVVIKNTPVGNAFLHIYSELFKSAYVPQGFNWGLDQNILCAIYDRFKYIWLIGNSFDLRNPFNVPYEIKKIIK